MKLIVGLGNPGREYENTRHNVGFILIDNYLGDVRFSSKFDGLYYKTSLFSEDVIFLKPQTFMNLSGNCVAKFINFFKIDLEDVLIIHDDLDLQNMKFRLKYDSSSGGHNGIKSIIEKVGSQKFSRLKVGIYDDNIYDVKNFVLSKLSNNEILFLADKNFNNIIDSFIRDGITKTMSRYNKK